MCLTIGQSATHERTGSRGIAGIERIDIEGHCITPTCARGDRNRFIHASTHPAFIYLAHRQETNSQFADKLTLFAIDVACAYVDTQRRVKLRRKSCDVGKVSNAVAEEYGQRHAVNIS